ncbi:MAG: glycosyltransferase, partial [Calditrichaeota bacterium]|nr:glycosyltransferase [Calditrichota bacterium]
MATIFILSTAISVAVSLFLLIGILRNRRRIAPNPELPSVAVIVAGRNERATIAGCLESLLALDYPPSRLECFFVDDGSTDGTVEIAAEIARTSQERLKVLYAPPNRTGLGPK